MPGAADLPETVKILDALRPAHLPPAAAFTAADLLLPVALGLLLAVVVALAWPRPIRGRRRVSLRVLGELAAARALPPQEALVAEARLVRRFVALRDGEAAARLDGEAYAAHLDRRFGTTFFTAGPGRRLVSLYAPAEPDTAEAEAVGQGLAELFGRVRA